MVVGVLDCIPAVFESKGAYTVLAFTCDTLPVYCRTRINKITIHICIFTCNQLSFRFTLHTSQSTWPGFINFSCCLAAVYPCMPSCLCLSDIFTETRFKCTISDKRQTVLKTKCLAEQKEVSRTKQADMLVLLDSQGQRRRWGARWATSSDVSPLWHCSERFTQQSISVLFILAKQYRTPTFLCPRALRSHGRVFSNVCLHLLCPYVLSFFRGNKRLLRTFLSSALMGFCCCAPPKQRAMTTPRGQPQCPSFPLPF